MNEISEAVSQGNIPILAIVGLLLLSVGVLAGYGFIRGVRLERKVFKTKDSGAGVLVAFISVLIYIPSTYWGWYFMTAGSM